MLIKTSTQDEIQESRSEDAPSNSLKFDGVCDADNL